MSDIAICGEGLSKRFRIGTQQPYHRFSEMLTSLGRTALTAPTSLLYPRAAKHRGNQRQAKQHDDTFWALENVSFEIKKGEVVGIIGRNGAGKSTLLKILSRITEPTKGRFGVTGRVGCLLEVGTGFHPELTGRENIYLSGTILGMTRADIKRHFEKIVAFAEIDQFLDTPVKRYSSGMKVRLGFAVAAHLNPHILIVDEVLAVGDVAFQKKCLGKMEDVAHSGRTVVFVSHNMAAVSNLCSRGIVLDKGRITISGDTAECISAYQTACITQTAMSLADRTERSGSGHVRFVGIEWEGADSLSPVVSGGRLCIRLTLEMTTTEDSPAHLAIVVSTTSGQRVITFDNSFVNRTVKLKGTRCTVCCETLCLPLAPGTYSLYLWLAVNGRVCDQIESAALLDVQECDAYGTGRMPDTAKHGPVLLPHSFTVDSD